PGEGYFVFCSHSAAWTPTCTGTYSGFADLATAVPMNYYHPSQSSPLELNSKIALANLNIQDAYTECNPQNVRMSNIGDQTFSVSWTTKDPCMGSVILHNDQVLLFQAFDDRGVRYSGTTHHVS